MFDNEGRIIDQYAVEDGLPESNMLRRYLSLGIEALEHSAKRRGDRYDFPEAPMGDRTAQAAETIYKMFQIWDDRWKGCRDDGTPAEVGYAMGKRDACAQFFLMLCSPGDERILEVMSCID